MKNIFCHASCRVGTVLLWSACTGIIGWLKCCGMPVTVAVFISYALNNFRTAE
jgi:hypothetical protein